MLTNKFKYSTLRFFDETRPSILSTCVQAAELRTTAPRPPFTKAIARLAAREARGTQPTRTPPRTQAITITTVLRLPLTMRARRILRPPVGTKRRNNPLPPRTATLLRHRGDMPQIALTPLTENLLPRRWGRTTVSDVHLTSAFVIANEKVINQIRIHCSSVFCLSLYPASCLATDACLRLCRTCVQFVFSDYE